MAVLASLRSRVFAATAIVAVLTIAAALGFATTRVTRQAEVELGRGLQEAARLVEEYHRVQLETARERALLVADLPKLKAAVDTVDPPTVEQLARDYRGLVRSDVFLVTDREGRVLVSLGAPATGLPGAASEPRSFVTEGGRLLETVTAPLVLGAESPEVLGRLTLGFALDDALAARLQALTGSQVAVAQGGRIHASTLPHTHDPALIAAAAGAGVVRLDLGGEDYAALRQPLGAGETSPVALVLRSRAEALRPLQTLRTALLVAALLAVALSLALSYAVARTVTRPLAALTDGMKAIAATGDLTRKIGSGGPWDDEDARLVARTFNRLTDSIARFQREAALRERLSALGRLSTVIAHEVRNPLMIIKGSLRTLKRDGARPEEVREAAADIDHEVTRLNRIVGDVLDFARPLCVEIAPTDVAHLCREATRSVLGEEDSIATRFVLDPPPGPVLTDGERLRGVLVNLVANARDSVVARRAAEAGAAPVVAEDLEVGVRRLDARRILLWVADRGTGIAAADLPHVYEPYFTTKRTGTGLGLAIARKTVEGLGGSIRIESREGEGTRIEIELPEAGATAAPEAP
jgi:signal transduction histidine kinase